MEIKRGKALGLVLFLGKYCSVFTMGKEGKGRGEKHGGAAVTLFRFHSKVF